MLTRRTLRQLAVLLPLVGACAGCGGDSGPHWVGKTYLLDAPAFSAGKWTKPPKFGADIGGYVPQFLFGVAAGAGGDLAITVATSYAGVQDACNPTTPVTSSGADYPKLQISAHTFPMRVLDSQKGTMVPATARDLIFKDVLPGDSAAKTGELDATVDVRDLYSLFHLISDNPTPDMVCSTFLSYNVPCDVCALDGQQYCLTLQAQAIGATQVPTPVVQVQASDISASCQ